MRLIVRIDLEADMTEPSADTRTGSESPSIPELIAIFVFRKVNLQHALYMMAFLTFGLGDGITGAYMMERIGVGIESNPFVRHLFVTQGFRGVVAAKIWVSLVLLLAVHIVQLRCPLQMYWTVNGFLSALTMGGLMAMNANLTVLAHGLPQDASEIILVYLCMALILIQIGNLADRRTDCRHRHLRC